MSESKHTPGPWITMHGINVIGDGRVVANCGTYVSSSDWTGALVAENEANARLIAAAPDLLAACLDIRDFLRISGYDTRMMDAAIAKARGNP